VSRQTTDFHFQSAPASAKVHDMRVLIVEDETNMARFIAKGLKEHGYAVDVSHDGEDGLFMATSEAYDLVILDLMLPKMNGLSVLKKMRQEEVEVPVIILTAKDAVEERVRGLETGADDYLAKPFAFSELLARMKACLRRKSGPLASDLRVGDLLLESSTRRAARAGRPVELTSTEYRLLEFMMRHEGEVLTRVQIMEHVWDYNFDSLSNVVDVHIHKLRAKIDRGHERPLIHTHRGAGYVLEERS